MRASRFVIVLLLLLSGCISETAKLHTIPPGTPRVGGAWIKIDLNPEKTHPLEGELIALDESCVFLRTEDNYQSIAWDKIFVAHVYLNDPRRRITVIGALMSAGALTSPFINGFAFLLTAPVWLVGGTIAIVTEVSQSRVKYRKDKEKFISKALPYARFPQGIPLEIYQKTSANADCPAPEAMPSTAPTSAPSSAPSTTLPASLPNQ